MHFYGIRSNYIMYMFICNFIVLLDKLFTRLLSIFHFSIPTSDAMHYLYSKSIAKRHVKCTLTL